MFSTIARTIKNYWGLVLRDADGVPSSKRFVLIAGSGSLFAAFWLGLVWGLHAPDNIVEAMKWVITGAGGGVALEGTRTQGKKND